MSMSTGTEDHWDDWNEGLTADPEPDTPMMPGDAAPAGSPPDDFPGELAVLLNKYGMADVFYVALSADGKTRARSWLIDVAPGAEDYRTRCARASFEATGLLQHMEGSTWPE